MPNKILSFLSYLDQGVLLKKQKGSKCKEYMYTCVLVSVQVHGVLVHVCASICGDQIPTAGVFPN